MKTKRRFRDLVVLITFEQVRALSQKCAIMLLLPLIPAVLAGLFWYYVIDLNGLYFHSDGELISVVAVGAVALIAAIFVVFLAEVFRTVWSEYKEMKKAAKKGDFKKFLELRDESLESLVYMMLGGPATIMLVSFMLLDCHNVAGQLWIVGIIAYSFAMVFVGLYELDNPLSGIWVLQINPRWRTLTLEEWKRENGTDASGAESITVSA